MDLFSSPSALILIVAAISILCFIIHGLWFSGKPTNRKITNEERNKDLGDDYKTRGKVRIVAPDIPNEQEDEKKVPVTESIELEKDLSKQNTLEKSYEIFVVAPEGQEFCGEDIEEICKEFGIVRGPLDIFYVFEDSVKQDREVFRICSLKKPFSFPQDLTGYKTNAMALYMNLPKKGLAWAYYHSMHYAATIFEQRLSARLQDNRHNPLDEKKLEEIENLLRSYDES